MKINRNLVNALIVLVIAIAAVALMITWILPRNYSGSELNLPVGAGMLTITNESSDTIPVMMVGTGPELFAVSSDVPVAVGTSIRSSMGVAGSHQYTFGLPPGTHEFTVLNNRDVNLYAWSTSMLSASMQPMSTFVQGLMIAVSVGIAVLALAYVSSLAYQGLTHRRPTGTIPARGEQRAHVRA